MKNIQILSLKKKLLLTSKRYSLYIFSLAVLGVESGVQASTPVAVAPAPTTTATTVTPTVALTPAAPTVAAPTVAAPTVAAPTVVAPTVAVPTIAVPTIAAPTIAAPTIATPTIATPTIAAPTIAAPTIAAPTIAAPTVATPTVATPVATPTTTATVISPTAVSNNPAMPALSADDLQQLAAATAAAQSLKVMGTLNPQTPGTLTTPAAVPAVTNTTTTVAVPAIGTTPAIVNTTAIPATGIVPAITNTAAIPATGIVPAITNTAGVPAVNPTIPGAAPVITNAVATTTVPAAAPVLANAVVTTVAPSMNAPAVSLPGGTFPAMPGVPFIDPNQANVQALAINALSNTMDPNTQDFMGSVHGRVLREAIKIEEKINERATEDAMKIMLESYRSEEKRKMNYELSSLLMKALDDPHTVRQEMLRKAIKMHDHRLMHMAAKEIVMDLAPGSVSAIQVKAVISAAHAAHRYNLNSGLND